MSRCKKCDDQNYVVLSCCSGHECGCMGQPVQITNCVDCNPEADKHIGSELEQHEHIEHLEFVQSYKGSQ